MSVTDGPSSPLLSSSPQRHSSSTSETTIVTTLSLSPSLLSPTNSPPNLSPKESVQRRPRHIQLESNSSSTLSPQFSTIPSQHSDSHQQQDIHIQEKENHRHDDDDDDDIIVSDDISISKINLNENTKQQSEQTPTMKTNDEKCSNQDCQNQEIIRCFNCNRLVEENQFLQRRVARLEIRLKKAVEVTQTHGQRLLRAAFQEKIKEITAEHAQKTTEMLNLQKKCCEEELEAMENENQASITSLQMELRAERVARERLMKQFDAERNGTLERTEATMQAVQRKLSQLHARATRLEKERNAFATANSEKQIMIEVLASTAAAKDVERRRLDLLSKTQEEERDRKNKMIDRLQNEVMDLRKRLERESAVNASLLASIERLQKDRDKELEQHAEDLADCKKESKQETERLGRLFASVMQDFANVQSDVSTND